MQNHGDMEESMSEIFLPSFCLTAESSLKTNSLANFAASIALRPIICLPPQNGPGLRGMRTVFKNAEAAALVKL